MLINPTLLIKEYHKAPLESINSRKVYVWARGEANVLSYFNELLTIAQQDFPNESLNEFDARVYVHYNGTTEPDFGICFYVSPFITMPEGYKEISPVLPRRIT